ncbi:MAG TPA: DegT/DnrJ/EryC1/StrS family aminotransferase [Victivallales bacterium]|nr:DegT/DnrJ/EryC1/StrS family aminotransferase [Victivallales bacterium]
MKIDFPGIQTHLTTDEEGIVMGVIRNSSTYSMGPELKKLEDDFSKWLGMPYCAGLSSCTAALELAAMLSGVGPNDEVILPAHTFTATALPFLRAGARLVFADIDPKTFVVSAVEIRKKITSKTKVIIPVHLYGLMAPMPEIMSIAKEHKCMVIEDCAQSPGASIGGKLAGSWGDISCFSFHSQKNINALGEGGLIACRDPEHYEKILGLRKIGNRPYKGQTQYWKPAMSNIIEAIPGKHPYNFALPEPNAAAARCLLMRISQINNRRNKQAKRIVESLKELPFFDFQAIPANYQHAYHLLVARVKSSTEKRDQLIETLFEEFTIKCVVQYNPLYNYELFQHNGYAEKTCPASDDFFEHMISFPFWTEMSDEVTDYISKSVEMATEKVFTK